MTAYQITASALIQAPPQVVYTIIADYNEGHPLILPRPPFVSLDVEQGGIGAGTVISVQMKVMGQLSGFRAVVSEPEPGRVLVETNDNGYISTFTVEPRADGRQAYVTITTDAAGRPGPLGAIERLMVSRILRSTYVKELAQLEALAKVRSETARAV